MKDLQKIKEFFSKPLKEERDIYDEIANEEFGMDYDQLGPNEKEWVRDEISNLNEGINPEVINKVNRFIKALANHYDYSEQDAVYAIMQALRTTNFQGINEAMTTAYESKSISDYKVGDILKFKDGEDWKVMKVKDNVGKLVIKPHNEKAKEGNVSLEIDIDASYLKKNLLEAKEEDAVDTITMDIPLFLRMLEYAREDAEQDLDLHDVTEKANKLGKKRGILQMDDYEEIVGATEEIKEEQLSFINKARAKSSLRQFLSGKRDDGMGKFDAIVYGIDTDGKKHQIKYYNDLQNYEKFALGDNPNIKEGMGGEIDEKYFVKVSNRDARKAIGTYDEYRDNFDIKKYDDTLYASNTPSDIYDFFYDLNSQDIEIDDWNIGEDDDYDYDSGYEDTLAETILRKLKSNFKK
jgi:hypothetical protein